MTFPGRAPSWDEIEEFCRIDEWVFVRSTDHTFWQKVLPSDEVLETHVSFVGNKTMSPGRFGAILREQLRATKAEVWTALQTKKPVDRPSPLDDDPVVTHEGWVVMGLLNQGIRQEEIEALSPDEARALLVEKWSEQTP